MPLQDMEDEHQSFNFGPMPGAVMNIMRLQIQLNAGGMPGGPMGPGSMGYIQGKLRAARNWNA